MSLWLWAAIVVVVVLVVALTLLATRWRETSYPCERWRQRLRDWWHWRRAGGGR